MKIKSTHFIFFLTLIYISGSSVYAAENVGDVTRIRGKATAAIERKSRPLTLDSDILINDNISTQRKTRLKMDFEDGSVITLGANTQMVVKEYFFDKKNNRLKTILKFSAGAFYSTTSKILKLNKENTYQVISPLAIIGARGTQFWGGHSKDLLEIVLLEGTSVYVENKMGRVEITEPGVGTEVRPGQPPTPPKPFSPERLQKAVKTVSWE